MSFMTICNGQTLLDEQEQLKGYKGSVQLDMHILNEGLPYRSKM